MQATLGGGLAEEVASLMTSCQEAQQGEVPLVSSEGRSFPVRTSYLGGWERRERQGMENAAAAAIASEHFSSLAVHCPGVLPPPLPPLPWARRGTTCLH
jgi:hypothetical protein